MNRLNLNFKLETNVERAEFVNEYVQRPEFQKRPLTEKELETIADYILYGKDENGKNSVQNKEVKIQTKSGTWDRKEEESLDALTESPTFSENIIQPLNLSSVTKIKREVFSREEARKIPALAEILEPLWRQIDEIDLILNFYDLKTGKRINPPRPELLKKFTEIEIESAREKSTHLNPYSYLKKRHLLVELRREQFTIRDNFVPTIQRSTPPEPYTPVEEFDFEQEIPIYPLGMQLDNEVAHLIFRPFNDIHPKAYTQKEIKQILSFYWFKQSERKTSILKYFFDFENLEHIYELYLASFEMDDITESKDNFLLKTLTYYTQMAELDEVHTEILYLKSKKEKNHVIANYINKKYNKSYTANYISTIFRQKILPKINHAATYHARLIENLTFEENFKSCNTCHKVYLIDGDNFVKKSRSLDGFSNRCKKCDRADRLARKG